MPKLDVQRNVSASVISKLTAVEHLILGNRLGERDLKLSALTNLNRLQIRNPDWDCLLPAVLEDVIALTQLEGLDYVQDRVDLTVMLTAEVTHGQVVKLLRGLPNLTRLKINSLPMVSELTNLRRLSLLGNGLYGVSSDDYVSPLTNLEVLRLRNGTRVTDAGLSRLTNLQKLHYFGAGEDTPITHLPDAQLTQLVLCDLCTVGDAELAKFTSLKNLYLIRCPSITEAGVMRLTNLKTLQFKDCGIQTQEAAEEIKNHLPLLEDYVPGIPTPGDDELELVEDEIDDDDDDEISDEDDEGDDDEHDYDDVLPGGRGAGEEYWDPW